MADVRAPITGVVWQILVGEGDAIAVDDLLAEVETDKAVAEIPCPHGGKISKVLITSGMSISPGTPILEIEPVSAGATSAPTAPAAPAPAAAPAATAPAAAATTAAPASSSPAPSAKTSATGRKISPLATRFIS